MKSFREILKETEQTFDRPARGDNFAINIREECLLETYVCDETADGIVLHADDRMIQLLEGYGLLAEGGVKNFMHDAAEKMTLEEFLKAYGHQFGPGEAEEFWHTVNDQELEEQGKLTFDHGHDAVDAGEYDYEGDMAKDDLETIIRAARRLTGMLDDNENMPEWVQSKINKAADYVDTAADYIESNREPESVTEGGARSLVAQDDEGAFAYKVYRDREWDEYVVKFYVNGQHQTDADYHTDDKNDAMSTAQQFLRYGPGGRTLDVMEAEYRGRKVPLGKPMKGDIKKSKVYVRKPNGNVVKVEFGDPNMKIKKHIPGRRKNFRARHNCDNPGPRWKARYWSCRAW